MSSRARGRRDPRGGDRAGEAQAAGEDIADALPHGEALAAAGAAADGEAVDDALDPEQAREEAIAAVLDAARAASRASRLSCPCEWEAAGLVPRR